VIAAPSQEETRSWEVMLEARRLPTDEVEKLVHFGRGARL
jgi:hypothetical protein